MPFDAQQTKQQISFAMGAMLLLHSSCQALIENEVAPSQSPWYPILDQELGDAENLVVGWRRSGFLYFQQEILGQIVDCGAAFLTAQPRIDALFASLRTQISASAKQEIVDALKALDAPVAAMIDSIAAYLQELAGFQTDMEDPHRRMIVTVSQVQAEAQDIRAQIDAINARIADLQRQVAADRDAIARAKAERDRGIVETIFGILFAPITGGASLILAGIGVASIADAEHQVSHLQAEIGDAQAGIAADQSNLTDDQRQIAALQGLTASVATSLDDMTRLDAALGSLRTSWTTLQGEVQGACGDVARAESWDEAAVAQVFFDAACIAWREVAELASSLADADAPTPTIVTIGARALEYRD
jgi:predicted  nucleic acid-binding Zn-ribbon protein